MLCVDDAIGFLRESAAERLLVVAARRPWAGATLPGHLATDVPETLYGSADLGLDRDGISVPGDGPGLGVWRLG